MADGLEIGEQEEIPQTQLPEGLPAQNEQVLYELLRAVTALTTAVTAIAGTMTPQSAQAAKTPIAAKHEETKEHKLSMQIQEALREYQAGSTTWYIAIDDLDLLDNFDSQEIIEEVRDLCDHMIADPKLYDAQGIAAAKHFLDELPIKDEPEQELEEGDVPEEEDLEGETVTLFPITIAEPPKQPPLRLMTPENQDMLDTLQNLEEALDKAEDNSLGWYEHINGHSATKLATLKAVLNNLKEIHEKAVRPDTKDDIALMNNRLVEALISAEPGEVNAYAFMELQAVRDEAENRIKRFKELEPETYLKPAKGNLEDQVKEMRHELNKLRSGRVTEKLNEVKLECSDALQRVEENAVNYSAEDLKTHRNGLEAMIKDADQLMGPSAEDFDKREAEIKQYMLKKQPWNNPSNFRKTFDQESGKKYFGLATVFQWVTSLVEKMGPDDASLYGHVASSDETPDPASPDDPSIS